MSSPSPILEKSSSKRKKLVWNILNTLFLAVVGSLCVIFGAVKSFWPDIEAFLYVATELP
jgi:hypothetical protein